MPRSLIRHVLNAWDFWRARRKLARAIPEFRELDRRLAAIRAGHARGSRVIVEAKRQAMTERLYRELGRGA